MLRLWTINGKQIDRTHVEVMVHCLSYTAAPEGLYVNALIGGLANGNIRCVKRMHRNTVTCMHQSYIA